MIPTARQSKGLSKGLELISATARHNKDGVYDLNLFDHHSKAKQGFRFGFELLRTKKSIAEQVWSFGFELQGTAARQNKV